MKKLIALCLLLTATVVHGQMKFAHVNSQRLLDSLPSYKKAENDLKKFQDDGMAELSVLEKQINDAYVKLDGIKNDLTPNTYSQVCPNTRNQRKNSINSRKLGRRILKTVYW